ncbi:MAG: DNA-formamidopyrimidine glycosylase [Ignavibacteriaceae bacterium]
MPELPEVETYRKYLDSTSLHKKIHSIEVTNAKILGKTSSASFKKTLKGTKLKSTKRHGKHLFVELSNRKWITMHFGMTGFLKYYKNNDEAPGHIRILFNFNNGFHLAYNCTRMLGKVDIIDNVEAYLEKKKLGIDPLEGKISVKDFYKLFKNRSGSIKAALMNQNILAGIGNIYSDEILFQAGIHPVSNLKRLKEDDLKIIYQKMNMVLKKAVSVNADFEKLPETYLSENRKKDENCPKCSGKIVKKTIGGRSSYFCSKHQKIK